MIAEKMAIRPLRAWEGGMQCRQCQHENRDAAKFCEACGSSLALNCPSCDNMARLGATFCDHCGTRLLSSVPTSTEASPITLDIPSITESSALGAERRQLTVMFCDLVESTVLSGQLDPEDLRDVIQAYQATCTEVIKQFEGYVAQLLGDGLLVYFSYPQAHEDDAQRAVRSGLGMLEAMRALNMRLERERGVQLAVRVGIHTGLVVVGEMGAEGRQEQLALGETPNVAARVQGLAEPDTVVISGATAELVQGYFEWQGLGQQTLRGTTEPTTLYRVLQESGLQSRLEIVPTLTPLVGRDSEVTLLLDRWKQARVGQGQAIVLSGEAGIGKSRLVQALKDHVAEGHYTRLECRSSPYYQNTVLYPLIDLTERSASFHRDDPSQIKLEKLERVLSHYQLPLEETVPLFAALLSLPVPENRYSSLDLSPQQQRQKVLETTVKLLLELTERQPLLFVVEDLHWVDPTTLELLGQLLDQAPTASILILLTCRPEFQSTWSPRSYLTGVTLNRLTRTQVEQIVERLTEGKCLPAEVLQQVVDKTDGVPLFVEEMTKALVESDHLTLTNGAYELMGPLPSFEIPSTLQDVLMARLDRLITAKGIAQMGATIGRQFTYELLRAVVPIDETVLRRELSQLVGAELLYQRGMPPHSTYLFKHALIQDAAYQSLLRRTRHQGHQRIVQALETQFQEIVEAHPERLAQHAFQGELWDKALTYFQLAGAKAIEQSTYQETVVCLEQALAAWYHLPESRDVMEQGIDLLCDLRQALVPLRVFEPGFEYLCKAETLAERLDDRQKLGRICVLMTHYFWFVGKYECAIERGQQALALTASGGYGILQAAVNNHLGQIFYTLGNYHQALNALRQNVEFFSSERVHERAGMIGPVLGAVGSHTWAAYCLQELGKVAEAGRHADEAVRIAEAAEHVGSVIFAYYCLGRLALFQGDVHEAVPPLEYALTCCHTANIPLWHRMLTATLGAVYALSGRVSEALQHLEQAAIMPEGSSVSTEMHVYTTMGEAWLLASQLDHALTHAKRALECSRDGKERGAQAWTLRLLGAISTHHNPPQTDQAETYCQQALALANELGMRPLQAHCHRGLSTLYNQIGKSEQAHAELSTAIDMYRDMEMTFWMPETGTVLAEVEKR